jgi:hypothetical protein
VAAFWCARGYSGRICDGLQEKAQMIPKAINKPTENAAPIDSATAATGFIGRGALLIGTIHLPN